MDNAKHMIVKHFNIAQESPRKYEVIRSNDDGEYFRFVGKSCSPIFKVRVLIWEDNKLTFQFCSNHAEETKIYLAVKKSKHLIVSDGKENNFVFDGKFSNCPNAETLALVTITFANDTHIIIASDRVSEIDRFVTVKDIDEDSTERFFAMLSGIKHDENITEKGDKQDGEFDPFSLANN